MAHRMAPLPYQSQSCCVFFIIIIVAECNMVVQSLAKSPHSEAQVRVCVCGGGGDGVGVLFSNSNKICVNVRRLFSP